ncbi:Type II secretion system protein E [Lacunisphaera limnophila]|uniref:Type II secretion system protein E n=1 Tax=Lacunisphaera limnophila TaxID=1838286 RepID=A0A1D8AYU4_9BACT|nr:GspE/PulE family protein [Lacunisphaera limnophila]AOS46068.1 Type II secretion system protein E [Lacunisphaera limnophila]
MFEGHDQAVHDLLAARRLVEPAALQAAYDEHRRSGKALARTVLDLGLIEPAGLLRAVAEHIGGEYAAVLPASLPDDAATFVGAALARTYGVAPLATDEFTVTVAAVDPFNPGLVNDLAFALERDVRVTVADPEQVQGLMRRHYGEDDASLEDVLGDLRAQARDATGTLSETDIEQMAGQTPIIRYVNLVLAQAIRDRASDLHFEPFEHEFRIRYRIDGALLELAPPPPALALPVISRLKVLASLNIAERRLPQDGRIRLTLAGRAVDLRVSTLPTQFGESVVLRVLDQSAVRLELAQLGLPPPVRRGVEAIIRRPNGIFIVTGPTGSGKTTTLYSCLKLLNQPEAKLLTVEDPVEYEIDGIMQVPVNLAAGLTFSRALRTFLRQDPDIVMVGEVRDLETAQIAIQASLTGHLVLTTLHTNDAPSAVTRLVDMGIAPFLLASTVEAVLAQRLLRRICPECRTAHTPPEALVRQLGVPAGTAFYRGAGCPACHQTGYRGRIGIFEFLLVSDALRELMVQGASLVALRQQAVADGMVTLREAALVALAAGDTTVEEVVKYI